jgi:Zn-dependent protease
VPSERSGDGPPTHPGLAPSDGFWIAEHAEDVVAECIDIAGVEATPRGAVFVGNQRPDAGRRFEEVSEELVRRGLDATLLDRGGGQAELVVSPHRADPPVSARRGLSAILLLATLGTTMWAGAVYHGTGAPLRASQWLAGLPYALALLAILGIHEMGHYLVARRRGVPVSLPYFIPAPGFLGTFGAFIRMGGLVRTRAAYFDVAVAGPLAGLAVALLAVYYGVASGSTLSGHGMDPHSSALFYFVYRLAGGEAAAGQMALGPVGFAGWLGLVVTALNLVPVGQLDGGHIAYATLGRRKAAALGTLVFGLLIAGGLLYSPHWLMWALIVWVISGSGHPPARNELLPIGTGRGALAVLALALLLSILLPWPA